jgi:hypothetical protein
MKTENLDDKLEDSERFIEGEYYFKISKEQFEIILIINMN